MCFAPFITPASSYNLSKNARIMDQYDSCKDAMLEALFSFDAHNQVGALCPCGSNDVRSDVCLECFSYDLSCPMCFINRHHSAPFHWAEVWDYDQGFFVRTELSLLRKDFAIQLGHPAGGICPSPVSGPSTCTVVHTNGIHNTQLAYCHCSGRPDKVAQSMGARLFPSSTVNPQVWFTFEVLRSFHVHTLKSQVSAEGYLEGLRQLTDNSGCSKVPVSTKHLYFLSNDNHSRSK